ncbi:hypothetical protein Dfer_0829 [Dyadobacter fermentans DSM 18053]|uniref:Uncharacterized protein n=1 Tax=Dyadobacter fermentans (strain ATCC 700827 / DSM 18053 / CIP 107007 / KCTC 52180 / NS114) TaxID=471854 RepID=C6W2B6_DYAFD|nr:hypothetical protein Dfer_0829 [Dyadobacter fermentans DSM 18053]
MYDGPISSIIEADPLSRIVIAAIAIPVKIAATYFTLYLMTTVCHDKTRPVRFYAYLFASIVFFGFMQRAVSYNIIYPKYYTQALDVRVGYLPKVEPF